MAARESDPKAAILSVKRNLYYYPARSQPVPFLFNFAENSEKMFNIGHTYTLCSSPKVSIWGNEHPFNQII